MMRYATLAFALVGMFVTGCQQAAEDTTPPIRSAGGSSAMPDFDPKVTAGVPVIQSTDPKEMETLVAAVAPRLGSRVDPFALFPEEKAFDRQQFAERLFAESGSFPSYFEVAPEYIQQAPPVLEPQPYRRLSGVVIADSVLALLELNDGNPAVLIRPGMQVPGTPWRVISIDENKAVLRRSGNTLPREITVKLEANPAQIAPQGGGFGGPGGMPGGMPGGFPGGAPRGGGFDAGEG